MQNRPVKSAERTLALFELFSETESPLTVGEVARGLSIPQPSASMLLRNLTDMAYLEYLPVVRKYQPTIRVLFINAWLNQSFPESRDFVIDFNRLHQTLGEATFVCIQREARIQSVLARGFDGAGKRGAMGASLSAPHHITVRSGLITSLTCTASGRILLGQKPDDEVLTWVRRSNAEAADPRHRVAEGEFMDLIARVRETGYAESAGEFTAHRASIAICVPSPLNFTPMAVAFSMSVERFPARKEAALAALRDFRERLSTGATAPVLMT